MPEIRLGWGLLGLSEGYATTPLEAERHRKRRNLFDRQDEIQLRRDNLIDELETQLKQSVSVVQIFALEWAVL